MWRSFRQLLAAVARTHQSSIKYMCACVFEPVVICCADLVGTNLWNDCRKERWIFLICSKQNCWFELSAFWQIGKLIILIKRSPAVLSADIRRILWATRCFDFLFCDTIYFILKNCCVYSFMICIQPLCRKIRCWYLVDLNGKIH